MEAQTTKLHELTVQSDWQKWTVVMEQDMGWDRILYRVSDQMLKFYLQGTLQIAPTPAYLKRIDIGKGEACCPLCTRRGGALYHILSVCNVALEQSRYTWRHNDVLKILHHVTGMFIRGIGQSSQGIKQEGVCVSWQEAKANGETTGVIGDCV